YLPHRNVERNRRSARCQRGRSCFNDLARVGIGRGEIDHERAPVGQKSAGRQQGGMMAALPTPVSTGSAFARGYGETPPQRLRGGRARFQGSLSIPIGDTPGGLGGLYLPRTVDNVPMWKVLLSSFIVVGVIAVHAQAPPTPAKPQEGTSQPKPAPPATTPAPAPKPTAPATTPPATTPPATTPPATAPPATT